MAYNLARLSKGVSSWVLLCQPNKIFNCTKIKHQHVRQFSTVLLNRSAKAYNNPANLGIKKCFDSPSLCGLRYFHTSKPRQVPAIIWVILRPLGKLAAILMGRSIRKWYSALPPNKKQLFKQWLMANAEKIGLVVAVLGIIGFVFFETHIQETPVTKRKRFILFTEDQFSSLADIEFQAQLALYQDKLFPANHPLCQQIERVAMRILNANQDIKQIFTKKWTVTVVNAPEIKNAFVTPTGQIFVFSGILNLCKNDDQLGVILAHEMAHSICGHAAEILSYTSWIDFIMMIGIALIWALPFSDALAAAFHFILNKITSLTITLPFNRKLESEADEVGLTMAAKACFDIREFVAFWRRMGLYETLELGLPPEIDVIKNVEFLSTHPAHYSRAEHLEGLIDEATKLRASCKCPRLPRIDPRAVLEQEVRTYEAKMQAEKLKNIIVLDIKPKSY
ncbi:metalloendopeptidase OMA1, mitochondrial [Tetranychus urticae]|uniref:Metalloendopeptidase OMA1, mitochondrial n=1 Tax=Tetranychus urticae TaxID=32264 RepID=T1KL87_TETUR|nr:metalloendopeptidase OMA1, mitochondrial [Tetranychus urticae]XP_015788237.1 metalloendopeptidase OMA1, mitochondrial [Tetranychus urticae]XP_015788238.1 metalloendopeptidase OMA1, mitochondrial [Tetranychus urticae]